MGDTLNRSLGWLCFDQMRSAFAAAAGTFVLSWMLYDLTGSKAAMGGLWLLSLSGQWLVQWLAGPWIDRWKRTVVMRASETIRGSAYAFVCAMWIAGQREAYVLLIGSFLSSLQVYDAAAGAIMPKLAAPDKLVRVNASVSGMVQLIRVVALPAAGLLTRVLAPEMLLSLLALLFFASWLPAAFIAELPHTDGEKRTWKSSFLQGIRVYRSNKVLYELAALVSVTSFGVCATQAMYLPYVTEILSGGSLEYGVFTAAFPLGYVCGSMLVGRLREPGAQLGAVMSAALFAGGVTYILLGVMTNLTAAVLIEAAAGAAMPFWNVYSSMIYYRMVPASLLGQVLSTKSLLTKAVTPFGVMYGAYWASAFGLPELFLSVGVLICAVSGAATIWHLKARIRKRTGIPASKE
ncbi:MFS transporter [Paenibacillus sp. VCA1]|uniref:MFS transporter n=1 Tax=Paenibacillus sp. VCA1 TaxID=3039148 RepID=UPI002870F0E5|nr:MFS transporter [Paenibacillus sp. VCA1]MDR9855249.1 MFS transporter [Paenibacillus sp. VCA1]